jgi:hypothetical protein
MDFTFGCWVGSFGDTGTIEERFTPPAGGLILATTRYIQDGRAIQFEFPHIAAASSGTVFLTPYPGGEKSQDAFRATEITERAVIFEAPEHDFSNRIMSRRQGNTLRARADAGPGTDGQRLEMVQKGC